MTKIRTGMQIFAAIALLSLLFPIAARSPRTTQFPFQMKTPPDFVKKAFKAKFPEANLKDIHCSADKVYAYCIFLSFKHKGLSVSGTFDRAKKTLLETQYLSDSSDYASVYPTEVAEKVKAYLAAKGEIEIYRVYRLERGDVEIFQVLYVIMPDRGTFFGVEFDATGNLVEAYKDP